MSFEIYYDKQPEKFLEKLDRHISSRIFGKIELTLKYSYSIRSLTCGWK